MAFRKNIRPTAVFLRKQRAETKSNIWEYRRFLSINKKWKRPGNNLVTRPTLFKRVPLKILMYSNSLQIHKANLHPRNIHWPATKTTNYISYNVKYFKPFMHVQWRYHLHTYSSFDLLQLDRLGEHESFLKLESVYGHSFEYFREISLGWINLWRYNWLD